MLHTAHGVPLHVRCCDGTDSTAIPTITAFLVLITRKQWKVHQKVTGQGPTQDKVLNHTTTCQNTREHVQNTHQYSKVTDPHRTTCDNTSETQANMSKHTPYQRWSPETDAPCVSTPPCWLSLPAPVPGRWGCGTERYGWHVNKP